MTERIGIASVALGLVVTACGSPNASPSPAAPSASTAEATGSVAPPSASFAPSPSALAPSPSAIVSTGWASPASGDTIAVDSVQVSARIGPGTTPAKVAFWGTSGGHRTTLCSAANPGSDGAWSCKANLRKVGVRPGSVTLGFDVTSSGGAVDKDAGGTEQVTWAVPPSPPTHVRITETPLNPFGTKVKVSWDPASVANAETVEVYGLTTCFAPATSTGKACIEIGTPLPSGTLKRFARVKPSAGSTSWPDLGEDVGAALGLHGTDDYYYGVLVVAVNHYGKSRFIIAGSAVSCYGCVY